MEYKRLGFTHIDAEFARLPEFTRTAMFRDEAYGIAAREEDLAKAALLGALDAVNILIERYQQKANLPHQLELRQRFRDGYMLGWKYARAHPEEDQPW